MECPPPPPPSPPPFVFPLCFSTGSQAAFARVATSIKLKINLRSQADGEIYPPVLVVVHTVVDIPAVQPSTTSNGDTNANTQASGDAAANLPTFTFTFEVSVDLPLGLSQFPLFGGGCSGSACAIYAYTFPSTNRTDSENDKLWCFAAQKRTGVAEQT
jgi:hypothetical protein